MSAKNAKDQNKQQLPSIYGNYRFTVEIEGLLVAGFSEVSGLESTIETMEYQEGGLNTYVHQLPVIVKYPPLVLKRGISDSINARILWDWYENYALNGGNVKKNGSITMSDLVGNELYRWDFFHARPIAWHGPTFDSNQSEIAIESIELVHEGLKWHENEYDTSLLFG